MNSNVLVLAALGLEALGALEGGTPFTREKAESARGLLKAYLDEANSTSSVLAAITQPHPPHGLSIAIVPGVAALVDGATGR